VTRRGPYRHPVKSHIRAGVKVRNYERGKGGKPARRTTVRPRRGSPDYTVKLYFDMGSESHRVPATNFTDAAQQGIRSLQTPQIPRRMRIKRLKT